MSPSTTTVTVTNGHPRPEDIDASYTHPLRDPVCHGLNELPGAKAKRAFVARYLTSQHNAPPGELTQPRTGRIAALAVDASSVGDDGGPKAEEVDMTSPLAHHLSQGLALTAGSALGATPPDTAACLAAFLMPNKAHLTAGARAWSKHAHRSQPQPTPSLPNGDLSHAGDSQSGAAAGVSDPGVDLKALKEAKEEQEIKIREKSDGWWGRPSGPVAGINERALVLFWKVIGGATWRNLHWLPHRVLVYEVRVEEGYGMRWSQDQRALFGEDEELQLKHGAGVEGRVRPLEPWIFRGFVEPMMENGHELGWRHPA